MAYLQVNIYYAYNLSMCTEILISTYFRTEACSQSWVICLLYKMLPIIKTKAVS